MSADVFASKLKTKPFGDEEKSFRYPNEQGNMKQEIASWASSILSGELENRLSPEEALADLEIIEAMLSSNGGPVELKHQVGG